MRRGFLGGTFDPPHFGHIHLAVTLQEHFAIDEVILSPSHISPLKEGREPEATNMQRKAMVTAAFSAVPHVTISFREIERNAPSFTIDAVRALMRDYPSDELFLFLGSDLFKELHKWKEIDELFSLAQPLSIGRGGFPLLGTESCSRTVQEKIEKGRCAAPSLEISSSLIRKRIRENKYCDHLLPVKVLDYIYENSIYSSN